MTRITKHHGLGNDFLVLWDDEPVSGEPAQDLAVRWCDRRRGIGADGLLVATAHPADGVDVGMVLYNADGSRAEMSGNGIRCLAQAAMRRFGRSSGVLTVATDAGIRLVQVDPASDPHSVLASVDMGAVEHIAAPATWDELACDPMRPVLHLGLGNPHAVVGVEDVDAVPLAALGAKVPMVNLEIVAPGPEPEAITMRVHERGAGIT
jgi:diaminopimelate epimerase